MKPSGRRARPVPGGGMLFQRMYTRLNCQGRPPQFQVEFFPYANLAHSIRLQHDVARVRVSDVLQNAPLEVLEAAAAILLARLYRRKLPPEIPDIYRKYSQAHATRRRLRALRKARARRRMRPPQGHIHNLEPLFEILNDRYFSGTLPKSTIGWSVHRWRSQLGIFDPALDQIIINSALDRPHVPEFVVAYVLFHEMLHRKYPIKLARCRLQAHSREFRMEEQRFADYRRAMRFLKRFS